MNLLSFIPPSNLPHLYLASGSLYRQNLLARLRIPFTVAIPNIDETVLANELPHETAHRLAIAKAQAIVEKQTDAPILVIGSDQVACIDNQPLGKPGNHANALAQLQLMRGRTVIFYTALCLWDNRTQHIYSRTIPTTVHMRNLPDAELDAYLHLEQPYDCAGSAKSESLGIVLIEKMESEDPSALIGLPLITLTDFLRQANYPLLNHLQPK